MNDFRKIKSLVFDNNTGQSHRQWIDVTVDVDRCKASPSYMYELSYSV